jgi:hypothetical protein
MTQLSIGKNAERKMGEKPYQRHLAEARLLYGRTTALESEGITLPAGPRASPKTGVGKLGSAIAFFNFERQNKRRCCEFWRLCRRQ